MGFFTKLELRKEYFESTKGFSKIEIVNLRKRQGFKVEINNLNGDIYVEGILSSFPQKIMVKDLIGLNDIRLGGITIYGFKHEAVLNFLNNNFSKVRDNWRISNTELLSFESFSRDVSRCTIHYLNGR
jgi:hypothetical protein